MKCDKGRLATNCLYFVGATMLLWIGSARADQASVQPASLAAAVSQPVAPVPLTTPVPLSPGSTSTTELQAITQISSAAIKASQDAVEQVKWVFSTASLVVTGLLGVLAFLGFQNIRSVAKSVREEARRRIDEEIAEAKKIMTVATQIAVRTQAALRLAFLAEKWAETEGNQQSCYQKAIAAIRDVRAAAEILQDLSTQSWTHSFEAYCLRALNQYQEAVSAQLISMQLSTVDEPLDHYNAACYYALIGNVQPATIQLKLAIDGGGERFKTYAKNDTDFVPVRNEQGIIDLLGPAEAINPIDSPEKTVPAQPPRKG